MDKKEKSERKSRLSKYIDLGNSRLKDSEIEKLEKVAKNKSKNDGKKKIFQTSYKTYDSSDTYHVKEKRVLEFHGNEEKIRVSEKITTKWDDGQVDVSTKNYSTAREILRIVEKFGDLFKS
ncbi:MAG: hypothetical protein Q3964_01065 [Carnobacterium sp.]|nr:hypothetical protein [Carnobacterium sp.]